MKKQILLIGGIGEGKTTLKQKLLCQELVYLKTQVMEYSNLFIDCPGEYLAIPRYYHVLIDASYQVAEIWALQDATSGRSCYPPNFAKVFRKPVVGVITKIDREKACPERAEEYLRQAGFGERVYRVSAQSGEGIAGLGCRVANLENC